MNSLSRINHLHHSKDTRTEEIRNNAGDAAVQSNLEEDI